MGVKGLLPSLRSITRPVSLDRYRGLTVAVDAMAWLHRGVYAGDVRTLARFQHQQRLAARRERRQNEEDEQQQQQQQQQRQREDFNTDENYRHGETAFSNNNRGVDAEESSPSRRIDFDRIAASAAATGESGTRPSNDDNPNGNFFDVRDLDRKLLQQRRHRHGKCRGRSSIDTGRNGRSSRPTDQVITPSQAQQAASQCVSYALRQAHRLSASFGMTVILVLDGDALPNKSSIDQQRRADRDKAYQDALSFESKGDTRNARKQYAKACSVTHDMRYDLIRQCRSSGVDFVVAPYEADAQLAQLAHSAAVDLIISEDSDLLAYGCPRVLFKVDVGEGRGEEIQLLRDLPSTSGTDLSFRNWTHDMFVYMCLLNGCDYCPGLPGIGIKTAHKLVRMHRTPAKLFRALRAAGRMPTEYDFEDAFWKAYRTFRHQTVYNRVTERVEPLLPIEDVSHGRGVGVMVTAAGGGGGGDCWDYVGPLMDDETAKAIATGRIHPSKKVPWSAVLAAAAAANDANRVTGDGLAGNIQRYPRDDIDRDHQDPQQKQQKQQQVATKRSPRQKLNKDLFKFFARKPEERDTNEDAADPSVSPSSRPPLQEIVLNAPDSGGDDNDRAHLLAAPLARGGGRPIPIHFNEYSSSLVGTSFEPLARRNKARAGRGGGGAPGRGRNISLAVQRLRATARSRLAQKVDHSRKSMKERNENKDRVGIGESSIGSVENPEVAAAGPAAVDRRSGEDSSRGITAFRSNPVLDGADSRPIFSRSNRSLQDAYHHCGAQEYSLAPDHVYGDSLDHCNGAQDLNGQNLGDGEHAFLASYEQEYTVEARQAFDHGVAEASQHALHQHPTESLDLSISSPQLKRQNVNTTPDFRDAAAAAAVEASSSDDDYRATFGMDCEGGHEFGFGSKQYVGGDSPFRRVDTVGVASYESQIEDPSQEGEPRNDENLYFYSDNGGTAAHNEYNYGIDGDRYRQPMHDAEKAAAGTIHCRELPLRSEHYEDNGINNMEADISPKDVLGFDFSEYDHDSAKLQQHAHTFTGDVIDTSGTHYEQFIDTTASYVPDGLGDSYGKHCVDDIGLQASMAATGIMDIQLAATYEY